MRNRRHAALLALLLGAGCGSIEVVQTEYATAEAAKAEGAIPRGWLPAWLPEDAKNIIEIHDVGTNESTFSFSTGQSDPILRDAVCTPIESKKGGEIFECCNPRTTLRTSKTLWLRSLYVMSHGILNFVLAKLGLIPFESPA